MKLVTLAILVLCSVLTICPLTWAAGLQFFMNTTEQQLLCIMATDGTDSSYIVDISITDFSEPKKKIILASASFCQPDVYVISERNLSIEATGSISQHQAKLDLRFNTENGCNSGNYLCEVTFRDSDGNLNRKHEIVEATIPDLIRSKQADYSDVILSVQVKDLRDTLTEAVDLLTNRSDGFEERLVNLVKRVESFGQSSASTTLLPYKSHQEKQDTEFSYPAQVNTYDSLANNTEDTLSSEQAEKADNLQLDVNPTTISPRLSDFLKINCTLNYWSLPDVVTILSLIISKAEMQNNQPQNFDELVSLTSFSSNQVSVMSQINATIKGHVGTNEDSFLSLQWTDPTETESGFYRCDANVLNKFGHPNKISTTVQVKSKHPGLGEAFEKVDILKSLLENKENRQSELELLVKSRNDTIMSLQSQLSQQNNTNEALQSQLGQQNNTIMSLQEQINQETKKNVVLQSQLDQQILKLQGIISIYFEKSDEYSGRIYLLSKQYFTNISASEAICESYGGYLTELDDKDENTFVKNFLNNVGDVNYVILGATDQEQEKKWKLIHSGNDLVYTDWHTREPTTDSTWNCMNIRGAYQWQMEDWPCTSRGLGEKFLCEIPF